MNFNGLFLTARVLRASYKIVTTSLMLYYIVHRVARRREPLAHYHRDQIDRVMHHRPRQNPGAWTRHDMDS